MGGLWDIVKSFLGSAPTASQGQVAAAGSCAVSATAAPARPDQALSAVTEPSAAIPPSPPHPSLAGVLNAYRYAAGCRAHRLMGPPPAKPVTEGILNAERHTWRTYRSGVLNAERHTWQPPFPGVINSERFKWKSYS